MVTPYTAIPSLPLRAADSHKGSFGTVLLAAGSAGMLGAAILAARGALRGGAGLVRAWLPEPLGPPFMAVVPAATTLRRDLDSRAALVGCHAVVVGPGLGSNAAGLVQDLLQVAEMPLVLDADALNSLAPLGGARSSPSLQQGPVDRGVGRPPRVITPHPGEAARLLGCTNGDVQKAREDAALELFERSGCITVLKGHGTLVTDGTRMFTNPSGNPGMATGGSGDVLAGLLGALLAQGMEPFEAAVLAVHAHGLAGDLVAETLGHAGLTAEDLPLAIAKVLAR